MHKIKLDIARQRVHAVSIKVAKKELFAFLAFSSSGSKNKDFFTKLVDVRFI